MRRQFEADSKEIGAVDVGAMIEAAKAELAATGAVDFEPDVLAGIYERYQAGEIDANKAQIEIQELLNSRGDYH